MRFPGVFLVLYAQNLEGSALAVTIGMLKVPKMVIGRVAASFKYSSGKPRTAAWR